MEGKDQEHCAPDDEDSVEFEALVARELAAIKRPRTEKRFGWWLAVSFACLYLDVPFQLIARPIPLAVRMLTLTPTQS